MTQVTIVVKISDAYSQNFQLFACRDRKNRKLYIFYQYLFFNIFQSHDNLYLTLQIISPITKKVRINFYLIHL